MTLKKGGGVLSGGENTATDNDEQLSASVDLFVFSVDLFVFDESLDGLRPAGAARGPFRRALFRGDWKMDQRSGVDPEGVARPARRAPPSKYYASAVRALRHERAHQPRIAAGGRPNRSGTQSQTGQKHARARRFQAR